MANDRQKRETERTGISLEKLLFRAGRMMAKRRFPNLSIQPFSMYVADLIRRDIEEEMRRLQPGSNPDDAVELFLEYLELADVPAEPYRRLLKTGREGSIQETRETEQEQSSRPSGKHAPSERPETDKISAKRKSRRKPGLPRG